MGLEIAGSKLLDVQDVAIYNAISAHIPFTFFAASIVIVSVFFLVVTFINKRISPGSTLFPGLITGKDNRLSISKLQVVLWTLIAILSYITLKMMEACCHVPMDTNIPHNLLILIGLNLTTLVLAKGMTGQAVEKGYIKTMSVQTSITDLYRADNDKTTDLMKFQMLCWTAVAVVVYFISFFAQFNGDVKNIGFPDIDSTLLYFMLVGQGAYLGDKAINKNKPKITGITPLVIQPGEAFSITGLFIENATTFTVNKAFSLEVSGWHTTPGGLTSARVVLPNNGCKVKATPVEITATTNGITTEPYFVQVNLA